MLVYLLSGQEPSRVSLDLDYVLLPGVTFLKVEETLGAPLGVHLAAVDVLVATTRDLLAHI
jgi:hypothetical protein